MLVTLQDLLNDVVPMHSQNSTGFGRLSAGSDEDEAKIKEDTGATLRCIPFDQPHSDLTCFFTGQAASEIVIFAKAH